jgi:membrane protein DedA with SNARE-associated domain
MRMLRELITSGVRGWGYPAIFLLMALESACIPVPSEVTMPVAGWFASPSQGHLNWVLAALLGAVANLAGSLVAYAVGATGGRAVALRWGRYVRLREHDLDRAERWFAHHGDAAVFWSRLLPVVRTFISLPAGMSRMRLGRFSAYTLLGSLPWSFGLAYGGYVLGRNWHRLASNVEVAAYVVLGIMVVGAAGLILRARRRPTAGVGAESKD